MEKKIKKVVRANLPETNSSSSHSVVICTDPKYLVKIGDPDFNLNIDENGVLRISSRDSCYGWEWEKYNDPLEKLWYACGIVFNYNSRDKLKRLFIDILKQYTGAKDVIFEWEEDRRLHPENYDADDIYNTGAPEIDHNSSDIFNEIIESRESIKNFIFNSHSWLFLGNDNSGADDGFYDVDEESSGKTKNAVASVYYDTPLGRIDIEIEDFPINEVLDSIYNDEIIDSVYFDTGTGNWSVVSRGYRWNSISISANTEQDKNMYLFTFFRESDTEHLYYMTNSLANYFSEKFKLKKGIFQDDYLDVNIKEVQEILGERRDEWKRVDIEIRTEEFGEL